MSEQAAHKPYRVLARKYRPKNFSELIGQEALVRTLTNAISSGRIAQAYMLTGVRGVGKTTTARIIAKALNYTGPDGTAGPTAGNTDDCEICRAIGEDRHPDVMEMDAASRTGVDDIREILDGVRYAPTSARYKIYIIDEVHMLSKAAFNALLKTLEEPPAHVLFIFATTEIRKVPVTVLSRCQRFDLRRVDIATLSAHYKSICGKEGVEAEDEAITLIARAADGSVRDGLSILDQAIALSSGTVSAQQVKDMLGLADRAKVMDMLEAALKGDCAESLNVAADLYSKGADPLTLMQDMLDLTHVMTRLKAAPDAGGLQAAMPQDMLDRAKEFAGMLGMPGLGRAWQVLLKGITEVQQAPGPFATLEMILIRLAYAADLPDPADLLKKLKNGQAVAANGAPAVAPRAAIHESRAPEPVAMRRAVGDDSGPAMMGAAQPQAALAAQVNTLHDVVALLEARGEMILAMQVFSYVHLVKIAPGHIEVRVKPEAQPNLTQELRKFLIMATGSQWLISISSAPGAPTLAEARDAANAALVNEAAAHPVVQAVVTTFPGAKINIVKNQN